jgi:hypothetical protein
VERNSVLASKFGISGAEWPEGVGTYSIRRNVVSTIYAICGICLELAPGSVIERNLVTGPGGGIGIGVNGSGLVARNRVRERDRGARHRDTHAERRQ